MRLTEEILDRALEHYVRVLDKEGKWFEAFLVRPGFVIRFETAPDHEFRFLEVYPVTSTEDPKSYRLEENLCWHTPRIMVRFDIVFDHLPESILDVVNLTFLDFLLMYSSDFPERYLAEQRLPINGD